MLDKDVQILGGVRIQRRRQDAAIAQRARPELHAALHPRDDFVLAVQIAHRAIQQFVGGHQIVEPQLAIFQNLFHFSGRNSSGPRQRSFREARFFCPKTLCQA